MLKLLRRIAVWFRKRTNPNRHLDILTLDEFTEETFVRYCADVFNLEIGEPQEGAMPGPFWLFHAGTKFKTAVVFIDIRKFWTATHVAPVKGPKPSETAYGVVFYTP